MAQMSNRVDYQFCLPLGRGSISMTSGDGLGGLSPGQYLSDLPAFTFPLPALKEAGVARGCL